MFMCERDHRWNDINSDMCSLTECQLNIENVIIGKRCYYSHCIVNYTGYRSRWPELQPRRSAAVDRAPIKYSHLSMVLCWLTSTKRHCCAPHLFLWFFLYTYFLLPFNIFRLFHPFRRVRSSIIVVNIPFLLITCLSSRFPRFLGFVFKSVLCFPLLFLERPLLCRLNFIISFLLRIHISEELILPLFLLPTFRILWEYVPRVRMPFPRLQST